MKIPMINHLYYNSKGEFFLTIGLGEYPKKKKEALTYQYVIFYPAHTRFPLYVMPIREFLNEYTKYEKEELNQYETLYLAQRIEIRKMIEEEGFFPRIDLFTSQEIALKIVPKPCDVYSIRVTKEMKEKFDIIPHPFGHFYSCYEHINTDLIIERTTFE